MGSMFQKQTPEVKVNNALAEENLNKTSQLYDSFINRIAGPSFGQPGGYGGSNYFAGKARKQNFSSPYRSSSVAGTIENPFPNGLGLGGGDGQSEMDRAYQSGQSMKNTLWDQYMQMVQQGMNPEAVDAYTKLARGNWFDPNATRNLYGLGVYDELAQTGGWNQQQRQDWRNRATATAQTGVGEILAQLGNQGTLQGGMAPGYTTASRNLQNDASRRLMDALTSGELGIQEQVNQNRLAAAQGASRAGEAYLQMLLSGMGEGAGGLAKGDYLKAGLLSDASRLYATAPGEYKMYLDALQQAMGDYMKLQQGSVGQLMNYNPNIPLGQRWGTALDNAGKIMGMASGAGMAYNAMRGPTQITAGTGGSYDPFSGTYNIGGRNQGGVGPGYGVNLPSWNSTNPAGSTGGYAMNPWFYGPYGIPGGGGNW